MLEILKAGTHIDSAGEEFSFLVQDLEDIATGYNFHSYRAPVLIGHDENQPALAIVARLRVVGDSLLAILMNVSPELQAMLEQGRFAGVSVALYPPGEPASPYAPDQWGLRHVALVQVPAVKGMTLPQFQSSDRAVYIQFAEAVPPVNPESAQLASLPSQKQSPTSSSKVAEAVQATAFELPESLPAQMALVLVNLRQFMVDMASIAQGDRYLPETLITAIEQSLTDTLQSIDNLPQNGELSTAIAEDANNVNGANDQKADPAIVEQVKPKPGKSAPVDTEQASAAIEMAEPSGNASDARQDRSTSDAETAAPLESEAELGDISDRLSQLKQQEEALLQLQQELAQREQAVKRAELEEFLEGLIKEGKLLPNEKQTLLTLMLALPDAPALAEFSEADPQAVSKPTAIVAFKQSLRDRPRIVTFGEVAGRTNQFTPRQ
jgi:hypothetical protein